MERMRKALKDASVDRQESDSNNLDVNMKQLEKQLASIPEVTPIKLSNEDIENLTQLVYVYSQQQNSYYMMFYAEFYRFVNFLSSKMCQLLPAEQGYTWGVLETDKNNETPGMWCIIDEIPTARDPAFQEMVDLVAEILDAVFENTQCLLDPAGMQHRQATYLKRMQSRFGVALTMLCSEKSFLGGCHKTYGRQKINPKNQHKPYYPGWCDARDHLINIFLMLEQAIYVTGLFEIILAKAYLIRQYDDEESELLKSCYPNLYGYIMRNIEVDVATNKEILLGAGYLEADFLKFTAQLAPILGVPSSNLLPPIINLRSTAAKLISAGMDAVMPIRLWEMLLGQKHVGILRKAMKRMQVELRERKLVPKTLPYNRFDTDEYNQSSSMYMRILLNSKNINRKDVPNAAVRAFGNHSIRDYHRLPDPSGKKDVFQFTGTFTYSMIRHMPFSLRFDSVMKKAMQKSSLDTKALVDHTIRQSDSIKFTSEKMNHVLKEIAENSFEVSVVDATAQENTARQEEEELIQRIESEEKEKQRKRCVNLKRKKKKKIQKRSSIRHNAVTKVARWWRRINAQRTETKSLLARLAVEREKHQHRIHSANKIRLWWMRVALEKQKQKEAAPKLLVQPKISWADMVDSESEEEDELEVEVEIKEQESEGYVVLTTVTNNTELENTGLESPMSVASAESAAASVHQCSESDLEDGCMSQPGEEPQGNEPVLEAQHTDPEPPSTPKPQESARETNTEPPSIPDPAPLPWCKFRTPRYMPGCWEVIGDFNECLVNIANYLDFLFNDQHLINGHQCLYNKITPFGVLPFHQLMRMEFVLYLLNNPKLLTTHAILNQDRVRPLRVSEQIQVLCMASEMSQLTLPTTQGIRRRYPNLT